MIKVVQFINKQDVYTIGMQKAFEKCDRYTCRYENLCLELKDIMADFERDKGIGEYSGLSKVSKLIYWIRMNRFMFERYGELKGSIVNIQYVSIFYVMLLPFLGRTFSRIVLSFWGSDLLRQNRFILAMLKLLIRKADAISFPTTDIADSFRVKIGRKYDDRIRIVRFGNYFLESIDNASDNDITSFVQKYGIDRGRKIVVLGYNRSREHHHAGAIQSIVDAGIRRDEVYIIIPWTYGPDDKAYRDEVESLVRDRYDYVFLDNRLTDPELVALRKLTDVIIIVQTTDALNATMLETMYSGGEVVIGAWLQYSDLYARGITMRKTDSVAGTGEVLRHTLDEPIDPEKRSKNIEIIRELYTWNNVINDWVDMYA